MKTKKIAQLYINYSLLSSIRIIDEFVIFFTIVGEFIEGTKQRHIQLGPKHMLDALKTFEIENKAIKNLHTSILQYLYVKNNSTARKYNQSPIKLVTMQSITFECVITSSQSN